MPTKHSDAWLGKTLGQGSRYQLDALLGYGRSGRVYKTLDRKLSLEGTSIYRALKFLAINLSDRQRGRAQFQSHVQLLTGVRSSRVIGVLDYGIASTRARNGQPLDLPFLVMEYVSAPSLAEILSHADHLSVERALVLARQMALSLQDLHRQGSSSPLIHGNLTPTNLFALQHSSGEDWIKIGDFGQFALLTQLQLPILTTTSQQQRAGAPIYAAPECFHPEATPDGRADLYSLGCVLYQMLAGTSPFGAISERQTWEQWGVMHQTQMVQPFDSSLQIPSSVEALVRRCLQKQPNDRLSTLKELDQALEREQQRLQDSNGAAVISLEDLELTTDDTVAAEPPTPRSSAPTSLLALIEDEVLEFLETALIRYDFRIRLSQEGDLLRISLYRKQDRPVDYAQVAQRIAEQIEILNLPEIGSLGIESYPPGSPDPDWRTQIILDSTLPEQIQSLSLSLQVSQIPRPDPEAVVAGAAIMALPSPAQVEERSDEGPVSIQDLDLAPELDLSAYCFVRNQLLLRTTLPTPSPDVAQAVQIFHELREFDKAQILPLLTTFFKDPRQIPRQDLSPKLQDWLSGIESLNEQKFKAVAIWLSRYCANPTHTLQEVQASLSAVVEAAMAERQQEQAPPASIVREMEPLLYQTRSHWLIQLLPWLSGGVLLVLVLMILPSPVSEFLFGLLGISTEGGMGNILVRLVLIGITLLPVLMLIAYRETQVLLTQSKAIVRLKSLLGQRESSEVALDGISDVELEGGSFLRSLGGGSLSLIRRGQPLQKIFAIRHPEQLQQQILFLKQQRALGHRLGGSGEISAQPASLGTSGSFPPKNRGDQDGWLGRLVGDGGRYRLETVIGQGGMGKVYRAQDQKLSINVAIKFMLAGNQAGDDERERFLREMQACINLQDSRIVKVLDYGVTTADVSGVSSVPFLVMEFISAPTLEAVMRHHSRLPVKRAVVIAQQIAASLQTVHTGVVIHGARVQFVHRDLKPSNVFLLKDSMGDETIKLADFGLVKFQGSISLETLSRTGDFRGTPNYAAPEQCEGRRTIDKRGDIYSLGCILYEMLAGTNPFGLRPNATPMQWMYAQVNMEARAFPKSLGIPESLEAVVLRCLAKEPGERFGTALELSSALNHLVR